MRQRHIDCAVMFVDMRGFTRASEHLGPDGVVALLEGYFELLVGVVGQHSGRACNMAGDGVVVAFGTGSCAADTGEQAARRSVRAAHALLDAWKTFAADWQARQGVITGLGIGIHYGPVIAGPIGPPSFRHDTVVGDTVNVVASGSAGDAVLVRGAVVHGIEALEVEGGAVVSLRTTEESANAVAAAEPSKLRLVLVGR